MRIVVDINHPAHVHYFKNFIRIMEQKGHSILITASEKEISYELLDKFGLDYVKIGNYGSSLFNKVVNLPVLDAKMYSSVRRFDPDIFLGFGSIRASHVSRLMKKPCVVMDDTEHAKYEHMLYVPFTDAILTPACFRKDFGKKQIRYNGFTELTYLHPNYFRPDPATLDELGISKDDTIIVMRFVSWNANHDVGQSGLSPEAKYEFIKGLEKYGRVIITSEMKLDRRLEQYKFRLSPEKLHQLLYYATLYVGEGATTASESAILGTHAIYVNTLRSGSTDEEEKYGLLYNFSDRQTMETRAFDKAMELLQDSSLRRDGKSLGRKLVADKIDVTSFLVNFIEGFVDRRERIPGARAAAMDL